MVLMLVATEGLSAPTARAKKAARSAYSIMSWPSLFRQSFRIIRISGPFGFAVAARANLKVTEKQSP
jgi:hypothetical protein